MPKVTKRSKTRANSAPDGIVSMTGFADGTCLVSGQRYEVSIRSVNSRFLELSIRVPPGIQMLEPLLREVLTPLLRRGKVEITLSRADAGLGQQLQRTLEPLRAVLASKEFRTFGEDDRPFAFQYLLAQDGLLQARGALSGADQQDLLEGVRSVAERFLSSREREGLRIGKAIFSAVAALRTLVDSMRAQRKEIVLRSRSRIEEKVLQAKSLGTNLDAVRVEQEIFWLLERSDIEEELARLLSHLTECFAVEKGKPQGKRLDFLTQEIGRELNTIGSKAAGADLQKLVIEGKLLNEQIREQVQNVL